MRISTTVIILSFVVWLPISAATAYDLELNVRGKTSLQTIAGTIGVSAVNDNLKPTALPYSTTSTVTHLGAASQSIYDFSNAGFVVTFEHARQGTDSQARSLGAIYFTPDEDINYVASGEYIAASTPGRRTTLSAGIYDLTEFSFTMLSFQRSFHTVNESFTLGLEEAKDENETIGSMTGTLLAGHNYSFSYVAEVIADPHPTHNGATSLGFVSLTFSPVP